MQMMGGNGNFRQNFQPPQNIMGKVDYQNRGQFVHDNMLESVLDSSITEYRLYVDSGDRDPVKQINPFQFTVTLNPDGPSNIMDRNTGVVETISGATTPHLPQDFRNVKYVRIDNVILPVYTVYTKVELVESDISGWIDAYDGTGTTNFRITNSAGAVITGLNAGSGISIKTMMDDDSFSYSGDPSAAEVLSYINTGLVATAHLTKRNQDSDPLASRTQITRMYNSALDYDYYFDPDADKWYIYTKDTGDASKLYDDRYVVLKVDELESQLVQGTNDTLGRSFGLIFPDRQFSTHYYQGSTFQSSITLDNSNLMNLNKLSLRFMNTDGTQLNFAHMSNDAYSVKDPRHPLHRHLQTEVSIIVGVYEPKQAREIQYHR